MNNSIHLNDVQMERFKTFFGISKDLVRFFQIFFREFEDFKSVRFRRHFGALKMV